MDQVIGVAAAIGLAGLYVAGMLYLIEHGAPIWFARIWDKIKDVIYVGIGMQAFDRWTADRAARAPRCRCYFPDCHPSVDCLRQAGTNGLCGRCFLMHATVEP